MAIAAFVTVAFAGVLSGAALDRYVLYLWGRPAARPPGGFPGGPRGGPPEGGRFGGRGGRGGPPEIPRLMRALDLSPAQKEGIDSLLDRQGKKLEAVRERIRPEIDSLVKETEREVEARLTPDQRTRYVELRSEMRRSRGRRGGPPR
jgi:hypothetical protein